MKNKKFAYVLLFSVLIHIISVSLPVISAEDNIIEISSKEDFAQFSRNCTLDTWSEGKTVNLTCDIDFSGSDFLPVPTFGGTFNGNGYTVSGIEIKSSGSYLGVFRYIQKSGKVTGLNVKANIIPVGSKCFVGGVAGENSGIIELCSFNGIIEGENVIGGIAGSNTDAGKIISCLSYGSISGENSTGGIAGKNSGMILDCTNNAEINTFYEEDGRHITDIETDTGAIIEEYKNTIEEKTKVADERNRNFAKKGIFDVDIGDFAKGIANTEYFPQMLQNGIVAKDYLGENSQSDCTPLDMDVELIKDKNTILTAKDYSSANVEGRALGTIILIIKNNGDFIKTREGNLVDPDAVEKVLTDKTKKEYFDNNGLGGTNASGIRTGIGSTNISFIISDRYVDKLGLEIARNGFYIPIVDGDRQLVFTPEMYDELRSKMQGMSYYGVSEFKLDESAKNEGTSKIIDLIEQNNEEVSQKRQKILNTINGAIEKCGLKMSDTRTRDLTKGIVEIIDTGSTGRGTNEPGQGDFDFMVRMDSNVLRESAQIKQALKEALSKVDKPQEADMTAKGDMRYKGVSIEGIDEKVDIDLSFVQRTNEVE